MKKLLALPISLLLFSCNLTQNNDSKISAKYRSSLNAAKDFYESMPEKSIQITDSILKDTLLLNDNQATLVRLYQIREAAFSKLNKLNFVIENAEKIRNNAVIVGDSSAIYESLKSNFINHI